MTKHNSMYRRSLLALAAVWMLGATASADLIFSDGFEGDLSAWVGQGGDPSAHHGTIVVDPLDSANHVLSFTETNWGGDIFGTAEGFTLAADQEYTISFRYLGDPSQNGTPGDLGGYAGLSSGFPASHLWYYGTNTVSNADPVLIDDGQWHSYTYTFTAPLSIGETIHLMFEDFYLSGYNLADVAGDVYFDDITLVAVPVPAAALLGMLGLGLSGLKLRKRV